MQYNKFNAMEWHARARAPPPRPTASEAEPRENSPPAAIPPSTRSSLPLAQARNRCAQGRGGDSPIARGRAGVQTARSSCCRGRPQGIRTSEGTSGRERARRSPTSEPSAPCGTFGRSNLDIWMLYLGPLERGPWASGLGFLGTLGNSAGLAAARNSRGRVPWPTHPCARGGPILSINRRRLPPSSRLYSGAARWPARGGARAPRALWSSSAAGPPAPGLLHQARTRGRGRRLGWAGGWRASGAPPAWRARDDPSSPRAANNQHPHHHNYRHQQY